MTGTRKSSPASKTDAEAGKLVSDKTSGKPPAAAAVSSPTVKVAKAAHSFKKSPGKKPKKNAAASPTKQTSGQESRAGVTLRGNTIVTCKTKCSSIVALTKKNGEEAAYLKPLIDWMTEGSHEEFVKNALKISYIGSQVDPGNPIYPLEDQPKPGKTYRPRHPLFVAVLPDDKASKNTESNRKAFAESIIQVNNSDKLQREYIEKSTRPELGGTLLSYGGDITPSEGELPPMSRFLPFRDVIKLIQTIYTDDEGNTPTLEFILGWDEWMDMYFLPEHIPKIKAVYGLNDDDGDTHSCDGVKVGSFVDLD